MNSVCQALGLVLTLPVYPFEALLKCSSLGHISVKVFVSITASCVQNRASPLVLSLHKRLCAWCGR